MGSIRSVSCAVALAAALLALPAPAFAGGPSARIAAPSAGLKWTAGGAIAVAGSGTSAAGRELPDGSLYWTLALQPCDGCSLTEVPTSTAGPARSPRPTTPRRPSWWCR